MEGRKFLSVVVPLYNEESRLINLDKIYRYLKTKKFESELIVVNDGSTDNTLPLLRKFSKKVKIRIISYKKNRGKGHAIKVGILSACGKNRLFTDIDLSSPIETFDDFFPYLDRFPVIIGSRRILGARVNVHQKWPREVMGKFFTFLSQEVLKLKFSDFTCGFKCFSDGAAEKIFRLARVDRWSFDSEVLFIAKKLGYPSIEIPVVWRNDPDTKVNFPRDIVRSLVDLIRIRVNDVRGLYL